MITSIDNIMNTFIGIQYCIITNLKLADFDFKINKVHFQLLRVKVLRENRVLRT